MSSKKYGPRLSINPPTVVPPVKITQKKRSKSLGGATLDQEVRRGKLGDPESFGLNSDLTPRKKARRSLVPGKSILKSRPTVTGLERSSDPNLAFSNQTQAILNPVTPSNLNLPSKNSLESSEICNTNLSSLLDSQKTGHQEMGKAGNRSEHERTENDASDDSSDMDVSGGLGFNRSSIGSNTTNVLRRVSFAAKAHVRTFGSPLVDPDSSISSSPHSATDNASGASTPSSPLQPEALPPSQADESADMSIDDSLTHGKAVISITSLDPAYIPPDVTTKVDQARQQKVSRLSTAIPGFGDYEEDDDDGDVTIEEINVFPNNIRDPMHPDPESLPSQSNQNLEDQPASEHEVDSTKDMDLTGPFQPIPNNTINSSRASHIPRLSSALKKGAPRRQSVSSDLFNKLKSSRLSMALPEYMRYNEAEDTENMDVEPSMLLQPDTASVSVEKITPQDTNSASQTTESKHEFQTIFGLTKNAEIKKASRLTEFLGFADEDTLPTSTKDQESDIPIVTYLESLSVNPHPRDSSTTTLTHTSLPPADQPRQKNIQHKPSRLTELFGTLNDDHDESGDESGDIDPSFTESTQLILEKRKQLSELKADKGSTTSPQKAKDQPKPTAILSSSAALPQVPFTAQDSRLSGFFQELRSRDDEIQPTSRSFKAVSDIARTPTVDFPNTNRKSTHSLIRNLSDRRDSQENATARILDHQRPINSINTPDLRRFSSAIPRHLVQISSASPSLSRRLSASPTKRAIALPSPRRSIEPQSARASVEPSSYTGTLQSASRGFFPQKTRESLNMASESNKGDQSNPTLDQSASVHQSNSSSAEGDTLLSNPTQPLPQETVPEPSITLSEFFEQAEIRFISLSQPRVRNHDQQEQFIATGSQKNTSSFAQQVYAGMVKIPRLRMLESSARTLRQRTEILDHTTKEQESDLQNNPSRSVVLRAWLQLQRQKEASVTEPNGQNHQNYLDELNTLMNQLRMKKSWVELSSKRDCYEFELEMKQAYKNSLSNRRQKLNKDLEMMRNMCNVVQPSIDALRDRKKNLTEEIRNRKQKNVEIENCDQNLLKALKEEAKDLAAVTEANRSALAESDFERNIWSNKLAELEEEKKEHLERIEHMKRGPDQSQRCTVQELVRLSNEFSMLQTLMGWQLVRYEDDLLELLMLSDIGVVFYLDSYDGKQSYRTVRRIEFRWARSKSSVVEDHDKYKVNVEEFFFHHLSTFYQGKKLDGRIKDYVQQIISIWNHARQLTWEINHLQSQFRIHIKTSLEAGSQSLNSPPPIMTVVAILHSKKHPTCLDVQFEFTGEEILDWKAESNISNISSTVTCSFGKADCQNLTYVVREHIDRGNRGALKGACEEALLTFDLTPGL